MYVLGNLAVSNTATQEINESYITTCVQAWHILQAVFSTHNLQMDTAKQERSHGAHGARSDARKSEPAIGDQKAYLGT